MRHLKIALPVIVFLFLAISILPQTSAYDSNPLYHTASYWSFVNVQRNISGMYIDQDNFTTPAVSTGTTFLPAGSIVNRSLVAVYVYSDNEQRLNTAVTVKDGGSLLYSSSTDDYDPGGITPPGVSTHVFDSGDFNLITVAGHTYHIRWDYTVHTIWWGTVLTNETFTLTIQEPTPTSNTAKWSSLKFVYVGPPGGWLHDTYPAVSTSAWNGATGYGTVSLGAGGTLQGVNFTVLIEAMGNYTLISSVTLYDGTTNISYKTESTSGGAGVHLITTNNVITGWHGTWTHQEPNGLQTTAGHAYSYLITYRYLDSVGALVKTEHFSISISEPVVPPVYYNWMNGIIFCIALFGPALMLGRYVPRYGVLIGLSAMSVLIFMFVSGFILMTFVTVVCCGLMMFTMRGD